MPSPIDSILESVFGHAVAGARSGLDRYGRWAAGLVGASRQWLAFSQTGRTCACTVATAHGATLCGALAMGPCHACGGPVCLDHALVSPTIAVCMGCVGLWRQRQMPSPQQPVRPAKTRADYLKVLGLKPTASDDNIRSKYKKLAVQHHPDHAKGDADRARRTKRMVEINAAYSWLIADSQAKAARAA